MFPTFENILLSFQWGAHIFGWIICGLSEHFVINDGAKRQKVKGIKPQGDTRFNLENSLYTRGKNHGRQPTSNFTMIGVRLAAYKK
jgi:hypothetical protein